MAHYILGMDAKLYYGSTVLVSSDASLGDWTEFDILTDVTLNLSTGESDITTRANSGWRATAPTLKDGSIDFEIVYKADDAGFEKIETAWDTNAEIAIAAMDGDITDAGSRGLTGNFTVTNFTRTEPLEEAIKYAVTLKPSSYTDWYEVAAS